MEKEEEREREKESAVYKTREIICTRGGQRSTPISHAPFPHSSMRSTEKKKRETNLPPNGLLFFFIGTAEYAPVTDFLHSLSLS